LNQAFDVFDQQLHALWVVKFSASLRTLAFYNCMKNLFVLLFLVASSFASAQYYEPADSATVRKKNAIGVFLTAPVLVIMGGEPRVPRFGVQYRHMLSREKTLRLTATYDQLNGNFDANDLVLGDVVGFGDSSITYNFRYDYHWRTMLRAGWEWSNPDARIAPVYGCDAMFGYSKYYDYRSLKTFSIDTLATSPVPDLENQLSEIAYRDEVRHMLWAGVDFSVGWRVNFGRGWQWQMQFSPELYVLVDKRVSIVPGTYFSSAPWPTIDMRLRILESVLSYRF
jgi:hypothetical protein